MRPQRAQGSTRRRPPVRGDFEPRRTRLSSLAKLTLPALARIHPVERLLRLLDRACEHRVVWISGRPGAGKTTLAASYIEARRLRPLWYCLDEGEGDPATFFYHLGVAAKHAAARGKPALPLLTPEYSRGLPAFTRRYFQSLYERLPPASIVVLDDYHEVPPDSCLHDLLPQGLAQTPDHVNVLILSRCQPPPAFARLRANGVLAVVPDDALRLTMEEVATVIQQRNVPASSARLEHLTEITQGWAAGVVVILESGLTSLRDTQAFDAAAPQAMFDYFAEEIFCRLDRDSREVLLVTAWLPTLTARMAQELTGIPEAEHILEDLVGKSYFTSRDVRTEPAYRYHPLFREFLLTRARKVHSAQRLDEIRRSAARLLEAAALPEAAVDLLQQAEAWGDIARVALNWAKTFIEQGRHTVLTRWLDLLPGSCFDGEPWLCYWRGFALLPVDPAATTHWCARAFSLFERRRDRTGLMLSWARIIQAIRFNPKGDVKQMDPWIEVADELLGEDSSFPSEEIEYHFTYGMYVALQHCRPRHPRYDAWRDRAIALGLSGTDSANRAYLAYLSISYETQRGHLAQAKLVLDAVSRVRELSALARSFSYLGVIQLQIEMGQLDDALGTMDAGLECSRTTGIHTWDTFLRWHGGRACLMHGNSVRAVQLLNDIATNADIADGVPGCYYNYLASLIALVHGDLPAAAMHAQKAIGLAEATGWMISEARGRLLYGRVLRGMGNLADAEVQLAQTLSLADRMDNPSLMCQGFMNQALVALDQGDSAKGSAALARGFHLARELGLKHSLWLIPADGSRLCCRALQAQIDPEFVKEVIGARRVVPEAWDIDHWPWPVKLLTLGRFELLKNDRPVALSRKAPQKLLKLLKVLVAWGAKAVPVAQLADALWPDQEGDAGHQAFTIAVHRLRKLLESDEAIQISEGRVSLNERFCWVDAWAFQRLLGEAERAGHAGDHVRRRSLSEKALDLYHGGFLASEGEEPWALALRDRLRSLFIRHSAAIANDLYVSGRHEEALSYYARGAEADPLAEEFYQGLMRCYLSTGRCAEGLGAYRRLRQMLSVTLGISPSSRSEALYQSLLGRAARS